MEIVFGRAGVRFVRCLEESMGVLLGMLKELGVGVDEKGERVGRWTGRE